MPHKIISRETVSGAVFFYKTAPKRGEMEWTIAVKFALSDHAPREHIGPRPRRLEVIDVENPRDRVVNESTDQRRKIKSNDEREDKGGREKTHTLHPVKLSARHGAGKVSEDQTHAA